jgi:predicted house-cleaning NTP pyrophosphatase (Maf/HAM1 superfamily)
MPTYSPSVVLANGKGVTVRDVDNRPFYDFTSGIGVQSVGYSHPKVVKAIQEQAAAMTHSSNLFANEPATRLAAKLVFVVDNLNEIPVNSSAAFSLSDEDIARYTAMVNTLDKAGAYAIQEHGELIVEKFSGELENIIGLPLIRLKTLLEKYSEN